MTKGYIFHKKNQIKSNLVRKNQTFFATSNDVRRKADIVLLHMLFGDSLQYAEPVKGTLESKENWSNDLITNNQTTKCNKIKYVSFIQTEKIEIPLIEQIEINETEQSEITKTEQVDHITSEEIAEIPFIELIEQNIMIPVIEQIESEQNFKLLLIEQNEQIIGIPTIEKIQIAETEQIIEIPSIEQSKQIFEILSIDQIEIVETEQIIEIPLIAGAEQIVEISSVEQNEEIIESTENKLIDESSSIEQNETLIEINENEQIIEIPAIENSLIEQSEEIIEIHLIENVSIQKIDLENIKPQKPNCQIKKIKPFNWVVCFLNAIYLLYREKTFKGNTLLDYVVTCYLLYKAFIFNNKLIKMRKDDYVPDKPSSRTSIVLKCLFYPIIILPTAFIGLLLTMD